MWFISRWELIKIKFLNSLEVSNFRWKYISKEINTYLRRVGVWPSQAINHPLILPSDPVSLWGESTSSAARTRMVKGFTLRSHRKNYLSIIYFFIYFFKIKLFYLCFTSMIKNQECTTMYHSGITQCYPEKLFILGLICQTLDLTENLVTKKYLKLFCKLN